MNFNNIAESVLWQLPGFIILKNTHSIYKGCNANFIALAGYKNLDSIIGITDDDLKCDASSYAAIFRRQDQEAMLCKPQTILDIHHFADNKLWICISRKIPLKDENQKVIGCINQMSEINLPLLNKVGIALTRTNYKRTENRLNSLTLSAEGYETHNISKRESECLFYILRGKTAKEIAKILHLSPRTVEEYTENLKFKFCCQTKTELVGKAISEGLLTTIPTSLFPNNLSRAIYS